MNIALSFPFFLLVWCLLFIDAAVLNCEKSRSIQTNNAVITFKNDTPSFTLKYSSQDPNYFITMDIKEITQDFGNSKLYYNLTSTKFDVDCKDVNSDTKDPVITFSTTLSNNASIQVKVFIYQNSREVQLPPQKADTGSGSLYIMASLSNWNTQENITYTDNMKTLITCYVGASVGASSLVPKYDREGFAYFIRVPAPESSVVLHFSKDIVISDRFGNSSYGRAVYTATTYNEYPISGLLHMALPFFSNGSTVTSITAIDFMAPISNKKEVQKENTRVVIIVSTVAGGLCLLIAVVTVILVWRHSKELKHGYTKQDNEETDTILKDS